MKLTVLGNYGPYPPEGGACSGYLVETEGAKLLMDLGSGVLSRLQRFVAPEQLSGVFLSHLHFDHASDLLPLKYYLEIKKATLNVYVAKEDSQLYKMLENIAEFNIINIKEGEDVQLGDIKMSFYEMRHTVSDFAVRLTADKTLTYTGDTMFCENVINAACGADLTLADCAQQTGCKAPHMTVDDAKVIKDSTSGRLMATHLNPNFDPSEGLKKYGIETSEQLRTYSI